MGAVVGKNLGGILYLMAGFPSNEHKNYMELHMVGNTTLRQRSIKGKSGPTAFLPNLFQTVEILEVQGAWGKRKRSPVWLIQPQVTEYGGPTECIWRSRDTTSRVASQDTVRWLPTSFEWQPVLYGSSAHRKYYLTQGVHCLWGLPR